MSPSIVSMHWVAFTGFTTKFDIWPCVYNVNRINVHFCWLCCTESAKYKQKIDFKEQIYRQWTIDTREPSGENLNWHWSEDSRMVWFLRWCSLARDICCTGNTEATVVIFIDFWRFFLIHWKFIWILLFLEFRERVEDNFPQLTEYYNTVSGLYLSVTPKRLRDKILDVEGDESSKIEKAVETIATPVPAPAQPNSTSK